MTFREYNITPMYVRNMLGIYRGLNIETLSVGDLVCLAKTGGTTISGRTEKGAFLIAETGGTSGKLISGSEPFWNIYALNSPSIWHLEGTTETGIYTLANYLRTFPNRSDYGLWLDSFSLHNLDARPLSLKASVDESTPITEIDMGYNDSKSNSFYLYPDVGELNYNDIFTRASFNWLTNPYLKVGSIIKGGSDINIANENETGKLSFSNATGVENGGGYLFATINPATLYVGNNTITAKLKVGNTDLVSNAFGLNNFDTQLNLKIKERVHFSSEYITIFGSGASESTSFDLTNFAPVIKPASGTSFAGMFPPYSGARYSITASLQMLDSRMGIEVYVTKATVTDEGDLSQAVTNGNAFKIANLSYYDYISSSYRYSLSYNGTFPTSIIDDTYSLVILVVSNTL